MSLVLTAAPAAEPATLAEAKAHLRIDGSAEDALIASLIVTSRLHIEAALGLALINQSWIWTIDAWPGTVGVSLPVWSVSPLEPISRQAAGVGLALPMRPVRSVERIMLKAADGTASVLDPRLYVLDGTSHPARLMPTTMLLPNPGQPAQGIEITLTAGFGPAASDVPAPIRLALLMLVTHWFENREPVELGARGVGPVRIPDTVSDLLMPYRSVRL